MSCPVPRLWGVLALAGLLFAGCEGRGTQEPRREAGPDTGSAPPLVGGECTYERQVFRATVDSVLTEGALLVRPDTALSAGGRCDLVRNVGGDRWRVPGPVAGPRATPGDSVEVATDVIVVGTCVPCSVNTRVVTGTGRQ